MRELYIKHPNALWHSTNADSTAPKRILNALLLNLAFTIIEFVGGLLSGSVAIMADAVHDFGDCVTLGVAYYLEKIARNKEKDNIFSYGYGRFSLLSAIISGVVILLGMAYILTEAVPRFWNPSEPYGPGMLALAVFGVLVNGIAAFGLSHGHTQNEKVLTWHKLEDVFGWIAVLIGSLFIILFEWNWVDPLLAVFVALYVGYNVSRNFIDSLKLMLQSVPEGFDPEKFLQEVEEVQGVSKAHDLHVWSLDGVKHILSMHIVVERLEKENISRVKSHIRDLANKHGDFHATIEVEVEKEHV